VQSSILGDEGLRNSRIIFTPHNYKNLGFFSSKQWPIVGLPGIMLTPDSLGHYDDICLLKAGMHADKTLFNSKEQLDQSIADEELKGIHMHIKKMLEEGKILCAMETKYGEENINQYYEGIENAYQQLLQDLKIKD
jgi:hypothetical protein